MNLMHTEVERVLLRREAIAARVRELGRTISSERDMERPLLAVTILKGAAIFAADLVREISGPVAMDFMAVSSYGTAAKSSGAVRIVKDLDETVAGKDVLLIEDILDTGLTLRYLREYLLGQGPRSLKVCVLLDKLDRHQVNVDIDYIGFRIPDAFVVGYGLDYAGRYRNVPDVLALRAEAVDE